MSDSVINPGPRFCFGIEHFSVDRNATRAAIEQAAQVLAQIRQDEIEATGLFEWIRAGGVRIEALLSEINSPT